MTRIEPSASLVSPIAASDGRGGHIASLDGMRAVSILLVLAAHIVSSKVFPGGMGVMVFFVISGFLISRLLFAEFSRNATIDLKSFYVRRFLRLYPVVLVFTAAVLIVYLARGLPINWIEPASAIFYFANYLYNAREIAGQWNGSMPFAIFWSLSIEEHFYLLFPVLFLVMRGNGWRILAAMAVIVAACLALRLGVAIARPDLVPTRTFYFQTEYRLDSIAWGVALAALCEFERGRSWVARMASPWAFVAGAVAILLCLAWRDPFFRETVRYTVIGIAIMVVLAGVLFQPKLGPLQRLLNTWPLIWIGRLSYSLYVWHFVSPQIMSYWMGHPAKPVAIVVEASISLTLALISFHWVEQPVLRLRRHFGSRADIEPAPAVSLSERSNLRT